MISLLPKCTRCGLPVTDSVEYQIEQHEKIKMGNYINGEWISDDCLAAEKKEEKEYSSPSQTSRSNANQCDNIGTASESDVSPNTPRADEANA